MSESSESEKIGLEGWTNWVYLAKSMLLELDTGYLLDGCLLTV
jgi:hypothetical protein